MNRHLRDRRYRRLYGADAPQSYERIWVAPASVVLRHDINAPGARRLRRQDSGLIAPGDWDRHLRPIDDSPKIAACLRHFRDGQSWEDSGIYAYMTRQIAKHGGKFDSCRTMDDLVERYAGMDRLYESIRAEGFLSFASQDAHRPREKGGVFVHIGRDGQPIFGCIGNHRMSVALALDLPEIPAQLGLVHEVAFAAGALDHYRRRVAERGHRPEGRAPRLHLGARVFSRATGRAL